MAQKKKKKKEEATDIAQNFLYRWKISLLFSFSDEDFMAKVKMEMNLITQSASYFSLLTH